MKKIEVNGLGVFIEIYKRREELTDIEVLKEAAKAITRDVMRRQEYESRANGHTNRDA